jgi:hypothetical protein
MHFIFNQFSIDHYLLSIDTHLLARMSKEWTFFIEMSLVEIKAVAKIKLSTFFLL